MGNCNKNIDVLSSKLDKNLDLVNPALMFKKLTNTAFLEYYDKMTKGDSKEAFNPEKTLGKLINEMFDSEDRIISTYLTLGDQSFNMESNKKVLPFNIDEAQSATLYVANMLLSILDSDVRRKNDKGEFITKAFKDLSYSDIINNKRNDIERQLIDRINKDILNQSEKGNDLVSKNNKLDPTSTEYLVNQKAIENNKKYVAFKKRILTNIKEHNIDLNIFNAARTHLDINKGISLKTRNELLSIAEEMDSEKLTKNFDDSKAFSVDTTLYFSKETKQAIAKLKDKDTPIHNSIDKYTGDANQIIVESVLNKMLYLVVHQNNIDGMIREWSKYTHIYGWMNDFIKMIQDDKDFSNGVFNDFNRALIHESKLMINNEKDSKVNVAVTTKDLLLSIADDIEDFVKSGLYRKKFTEELLLEDIRKFDQLIEDYNNNIKTDPLLIKLEQDRLDALTNGGNTRLAFDNLIFQLVNNDKGNEIITDILNLCNKYNIPLTSEVIYSRLFKERNIEGIKEIIYPIIKHLTNIQANLDNKMDKLKLNHSNTIDIAKSIFNNSSTNLDLIFFDAKGDKKYRIALPTMLSDFESIMFTHNEEHMQDMNKPTRLELFYESIKDMAWVKNSTWWGVNGKFIKYTGPKTKDYVINVENIKSFKVEILSQMVNLNFNEVSEYKSFTDIDWFISNFFAFGGTMNDKTSRVNFNRTFFPTQSDSSVPRVVFAPSFNTDQLFNHLFKSELEVLSQKNITLPNDFVLKEVWDKLATFPNETIEHTGSISDNMQLSKRLVVKLIENYGMYDFNATYNITAFGKTIKARKVRGKDAFLFNPTSTTIPHINFEDVKIQELIDIANQDINIFQQGRDLILNSQGDLVDDIEDILLPSDAYWKLIPIGDVKLGDMWCSMSVPLAGDEYLTNGNPANRLVNENYAKLFRDENGFVGNAMKFANFPKLSELFDPITLQRRDDLKDDKLFNAEVKRIVFEFIKGNFDEYYAKYEKTIEDIKTYMSKQEIEHGPFRNMTNVEIKSEVFKIYIHRLVNNNELTHLFLGNFSNVFTANKRAKSIFSGKETSSPLNLNKERSRNDKIRMIVADDIVSSSILNKQRAEIAERMLSQFIKNEDLLKKQVKAITSAYTGITKSDGQTLITLPFWIKMMKQKNQWYKYRDLFEESKDDKGNIKYTIIKNPNLKLLSELLVPGKPFGKSTNQPIVIGDQVIPYNQQLKTSYIVAIPEYIGEPSLRTLIEHMLENDIDMLTFASSCKEQVNYINDTFNTDGTVKLDNIKNSFVDEFNAHDFGNILEIPDEHLDKQTKVGIQIAKLIKRYINLDATYTTLITGKESSGKELKSLIENIESLNIKEGFKNACEGLGVSYEIDENGQMQILSINYQKLISYLTDATLAKDRLNLADMLELDENNNPMIPICHPTNLINNLSLITSKFKNSVTNQKTLGGHFVLFSDIYQNLYNELPTNEINQAYKDESKNLKCEMDPNTGAIILDCKISMYTAQLLFGNKIKDLSQVSEELKYLVGYRIPTTGQESMVVLKVVGILPSTIKSSIVVNHEIIPRTGTDFDVDHLYLMFKEGYSTLNGINSYKDLTFNDYKEYNNLLNKKNDLIDGFYRLLESGNKNLGDIINEVSIYNQTVQNHIDFALTNNLTIDQFDTWIDNLIVEIDNIHASIGIINKDIKDSSDENRKSILQGTKNIYLKELEELKAVKRIVSNKLRDLDTIELESYKSKLEGVLSKITKLNTDNQNKASIYTLRSLIGGIDDNNIRTKLHDILKEIEIVNKTIKDGQYDQFDRLNYNIPEGDKVDNLEFQPKVLRDNQLIDSYLAILTNENSFLTGSKAAEFNRLQAFNDSKINNKGISTFSSPLTQDTLQNRAVTGKNILPIAASINSLDAVFEQMKVISPIEVKFIINYKDSLTYEELAKIYGSENVKPIYINEEVNYEITNNKLGWNNNASIISDGTNIGNNLGEHVNNAADYVKKPMPPFISVIAEPYILVLEELQVPINIIHDFFNNPLIIDYFKNSTSNILNPSLDWSIDKQKGKIIGEMLPSILEDKTITKDLSPSQIKVLENALKDFTKNGYIYNDKLKNIYDMFDIGIDTEINLSISEKGELLDQFKNKLKVLDALNNIKKLQSLESIYSKVLNVDKKSIAPNVNNYYIIQNNIAIIESRKKEGMVLRSEVSGTELLEGIIDNKYYKSLDAYYNFGQELPYKIVQQLFPHFNESLQLQTKILENSLTGVSLKTKEKIHNNARLYSIYRKYANNNFLRLDTGISLHNILSDKLLDVNPYIYTDPDEYIKYLLNKNESFKKENIQKEVYRNNNIEFVEDLSFGYRNRTIQNASADATIALAIDFNSAGEKLTKSSVLNQGKKYIPINANNFNVTQERVDKIVDTLNSISKENSFVAAIPQNLVSGIESFGTKQEANAEAKKILGDTPHSIDMIEAGIRTRTTRSVGEMEKYNIKVGDIVKQFGKSADGTTKQILTRVTAIHPKGTPGFLGTWNKEGWTQEGIRAIERYKDGAAAIEFEIVTEQEFKGISLNIAGNGIYTMKGKYTQQEVDNFTYSLLKEVLNSPNLKSKITLIRTGGQTGFDEAGAKAGVKLKIPTLVLAPKGWKFRNALGVDIGDELEFKKRFNDLDNISGIKNVNRSEQLSIDFDIDITNSLTEITPINYEDDILNAYKQFTNISDKLEYVKQLLFTNNIDNDFIKRLVPRTDAKGLSISLKFDNKNLNEKVVINAFESLIEPNPILSNKDNLIIDSLMSDLIRYSFYTSGLNFQFEGFSNIIPSRIIKKLDFNDTLEQSIIKDRELFGVNDINEPTNTEMYNNIKEVLNFMLEGKYIDSIPQAPTFIKVKDEEVRLFPINQSFVKISTNKMWNLEDRLKESPIVYTKEYIKDENGNDVLNLRYFIKVGIWSDKSINDKTENTSYWYQEVSGKGSFQHFGFNRDNLSDVNVEGMYANAIEHNFPTVSAYELSLKEGTPLAYPSPLFKTWLLKDTDTFDFEEQRESDADNISINETLDMFNRLQKRFKDLGIESSLEIDGDLEGAAKVLPDGTIKVNPRNIRADSIHHEFGHIILDLIDDVAFVKQGMEQSKTSPTYDKIKKLYSDYNEERLLKEVLVTDIGLLSSNLEARPKLVVWFKYFLHKFSAFLSKVTNGKLGKDMTVVERIAYGMINTNVLPLLNLKLKVQENNQLIERDIRALKDFTVNVHKQFVNIDSAINKTIKFYNNHKNDIIGENEIRFLGTIKSELSVDYMLGKLGLMQDGLDTINDPLATLSPFEIEFAKYDESVNMKITDLRVNGTKYNMTGDTLNHATVEISKVIDTIGNLMKFSNTFITNQFKELDSLRTLVGNVYDTYCDFSEGKIKNNPFDRIPQVTINEWSSKIIAIKEIFELYDLLSFNALKDIPLDSKPEEITKTQLRDAIKNKVNDPTTFNKVMHDYQQYLNYKLYEVVQQSSNLFKDEADIEPTLDSNTIGGIKKNIAFVQKVVTMWAVNKTNNEDFKTQLLKLTDNNNAPSDATRVQALLLSAHTSHDAVVANIAKMINSIDNAITINSKAEIKNYEAVEAAMFKALKDYNSKHGTKLTEDIFYHEGKLISQFDIDKFWEEYGKRGTKLISIRGETIEVPISFKEFIIEQKGLYDLEGAKKAYNNKSEELKNNKITKEEFEKWKDKHVATMYDDAKGKLLVFPKIGGDYIYIGSAFENKEYNKFLELASEYPAIKQMYDLIHRFQIEYTKEINSNPQTKGLAIAMRRKKSIREKLFNRTKNTDAIETARKLNLIDDEPTFKSLSFKYLGLLDKKSEYYLPKRYVNEELEEYKQRALNSVNNGYTKTFETYEEIIDENEKIRKSNVEHHIEVAETRPSKFMRTFIQEMYTIRTQRQYEMVISMLREQVAQTEYKKGRVLGNVSYGIKDMIKGIKNDIQSDHILSKNTSEKNRLLKQLDALLDRQFYRTSDKLFLSKSNWNRFLANKVTKKLGYLSSLSYMGWKGLLAVKDFISGRLKMYGVASEGIHFNFADLLYGTYIKTPLIYIQKGLIGSDTFIDKYTNKHILPSKLQNVYQTEDYILSVFTNYVNYMAFLKDKDLLQATLEKGLALPFLPQTISSNIQETMLVSIMTEVNNFIGDKLLSQKEYINSQVQGINKENVTLYRDKQLSLLNSINKTKLNKEQIDQYNKLISKLNTITTPNELRKTITKSAKFYYDTQKVKLLDKIEIKNGKLRYKIDPNILNQTLPEYRKSMKNYNTIEQMYYRIEKVIEEALNKGIPFEDLFSIENGDKIIKPFILDQLEEEFKLLKDLQGLQTKSYYHILNDIMTYNVTNNNVEPGFLLSIDNQLLNIVTNFKSKVTSISHKNQGVYNTEHKPAISNSVLGGQLMKMFQWFPPLMDEVIGARSDYRETYNFDGKWTPAYEEMSQHYRAGSMTYIQTRFIVGPMLEMTYFTTAKAYFNMIQTLKRNKIDTKYLEVSMSKKVDQILDRYRWADPATKGMIKKVAARDIIMLVVVLLTNGLAKSLLPDDKEDDETFAMLYYIARSVGMEYVSMFFLGTLYGVEGKYEAPMAGASYIIDMVELIIMFSKEPEPLDTRTKALWGEGYKTNTDVAFARINPLQNFNPNTFMDANMAQYRKITGKYEGYKKTEPKVDLKLDSRILVKPIYDLLFGNVDYKSEKDKLKEEKSKATKMKTVNAFDEYQKQLRLNSGNAE